MFQNLTAAAIAFSFCVATASPIDLASLEEFRFSEQIESATPTFRSGIDNPSDELNPLKHPILQRRYFAKYEEVIRHLHEGVEQETDVIYFVNTLDKSNACESFDFLNVPNQHMMILKRKSPQRPMFIRDSSGTITDIDPQGSEILTLSGPAKQIDYQMSPVFKSLQSVSTTSETTFIPVSTGIPGTGKILTYSGIFRINERRTNDMRKSTNTTSDPMQYSVYINGEYNDGAEARLALHGTSKNYWGLLGEKRASSGCIRLRTEFSKWNQSFLFDKASDGQLVPKPELTGMVKVWNRRDHFPPASEQFEKSATGKKLKVLILFFDGYSNTCS